MPRCKKGISDQHETWIHRGKFKIATINKKTDEIQILKGFKHHYRGATAWDIESVHKGVGTAAAKERQARKLLGC